MTRRAYSFDTEPAASMFRLLLEWAGSRDAQLLLVARDQLDLNLRGRALLERLESDLVSSTKSSEWPGTQLLGHEARILRYRLTRHVIDAIGSVPEGLFQWLQPDLPEDPAILRPDGSALLTTVAHERDAWLSLDDAECRDLANALPSITALLGPPD